MKLATGHYNGTVRLWDLIAGVEIRSLRYTHLPIERVAWSLDSTTVFAVGRGLTIQAWEAQSGEPRGVFHRSEGDGNALLNLIGTPNFDRNDPKRSRLIEAIGWQLSQEMIGIFNFAESSSVYECLEAWGGARLTFIFPLMAFPKAISLRSNQGNDGCIVHTTLAGTPVGAFVPGSGSSMHRSTDWVTIFTPDDETLASTRGSKIRLWKLSRQHFRDEALSTSSESGDSIPPSEPRRMHKPPSPPPPRSSTRNLRYDVTPPRILGASRQRSHALAFSLDGRTLASGGHDGVVCLWNMARGSEPARFDWKIGEIDAVAFSPDGSTVAAGGRTGIVVWDVVEGFDS